MPLRATFIAAVGFAALLPAPAIFADEGMWPYNQFPKDKVAVTTEFLDNLRLASVQVAGGSGSFVSPKHYARQGFPFGL